MAKPSEKTILVVDDEADVVKYLKMALTDAGFKVVTAADGFEALEQVKKHQPDLISLDLVMPKHSGAKFYRDMQKDKCWKNIPILIVTGHAHDDLGRADLKELTMSGPGVYLEKPVKPANYIAAVKKLLGMESTPEDDAREEETLKEQLGELLDGADPAEIKKAIDMLKKRK
jgi:CheY-like chemotaxis protein